MPKTHLTDLVVRNLKPTHTQMTYWDTASNVPGFNVRVSQGGTKTFTLVLGVERRRITLGRYPALSLQADRKQAQRLIAEHMLTGAASKIKFEEALELFLNTHCKLRNKPRTAAGTERLLRRHFGDLVGRRLDSITVREVGAIIDELLSTPSEANHAFVALKTFFNWSVRRGLLQTHPLIAQQKPARCVTRDRVLSDAELVALGQAAQESSAQFDQIFLLLLLTGQRRGEIAGLRWSFVNLPERTIILPASLTKNNREHTLPYGRAVAQIFDALPRVNEFVFPSASDPNRPFTNFSLAKRYLDKRCPLPAWTLHDLRRTFATKLAELKVPPHVTERLLNHVSGTISGVAAIYNRWQYLDEMRAAICKHEQHLTALGALRPLGITTSLVSSR